MKLTKLIAALTLVSVFVLLFLFAAPTAFAQTDKVTIAVTDTTTGKPVPGEPVHLYKGGVGKCKCVPPCDIAPDVTLTTNTTKGPKGRVTTTLDANTDYLACIEDKCMDRRTPCVNAADCQFAGPKCQTFMTNAKGGRAKLVEISK